MGEYEPDDSRIVTNVAASFATPASIWLAQAERASIKPSETTAVIRRAVIYPSLGVSE